MHRYLVDEEGVPLIEYVPDPADRIDIEDFHATGMSDFASGVEHLSTVPWKQAPDPVDAMTLKETEARMKYILGVMRDWETKIRARGDKYSYVVFNGVQVFPVYLRRAGVEEIHQLRTLARAELGLVQERYMAIKKLLKIEDE